MTILWRWFLHPQKASGSSKYFKAGKWLRKNKSVCLNIFLFQDMSISFSLKICLSHSLSRYVSLILSQDSSQEIKYERQIVREESFEIYTYIRRYNQGIFWEWNDMRQSTHHMPRLRWDEIILASYFETEMRWDNLNTIFRDWDEMR